MPNLAASWALIRRISASSTLGLVFVLFAPLIEPGLRSTFGERESLLHSSREQEIRNRAYEIYLQRGGQSGYELEDWLQAERELTAN
jgi:hypothetical protein